MLEEAGQVAAIFGAVLVPVALGISAVQTRLLRRQIAEETTARYAQIYQALHENMAQRASLFLDYADYRPTFYGNQPLPEGLDEQVAETLAEMTLDLLDTTAVQASVLPAEMREPWVRVCQTIFSDSAYVRAQWLLVRDEYSVHLRRLMPDPASLVHEGDLGHVPSVPPDAVP